MIILKSEWNRNRNNIEKLVYIGIYIYNLDINIILLKRTRAELLQYL